MNKKTVILLIIVTILLMLCITGTVAFLAKQVDTDNIITFGNIKMQLIETKTNDNNEEVEVTDGETLDITYESELKRKIKIKNLGNSSIYVRVALDTIGTDREGVNFETKDFVDYNINQENWTYKDGWYYYNQQLEPDQTTEELDTKIKFDLNEITKKYPKSSFELKINAQAVQAKNNSNQVLEADGWPLE